MSLYQWIRDREINGNKAKPAKPFYCYDGNKIYLIINITYEIMKVETMRWYDGSYKPSKDEIPMFIQAERILNKPRPATVEEAVEKGYKNIMLYFLRRESDELDENSCFGEHEFLFYVIAAIETLEQM